MTFSIAGRCARTGALGAAISTSSIAVTSRCVWVKSNIGVVLSQNVTDPRLGQLGLSLLSQGYGSKAVLDEIIKARPDANWRQLAVLDADGYSNYFSGAKALGINAGAQGKNCIAIGNLLANASVPESMVQTFVANADEPLGARLLAALRAGLENGGETAEVRSAGLVVFGPESWPTVDLRVDWDADPINKLHDIWKIYEPQMADYILRAKWPDLAPEF